MTAMNLMARGPLRLAARRADDGDCRVGAQGKQKVSFLCHARVKGASLTSTRPTNPLFHHNRSRTKLTNHNHQNTRHQGGPHDRALERQDGFLHGFGRGHRRATAARVCAGRRTCHRDRHRYGGARDAEARGHRRRRYNSTCAIRPPSARSPRSIGAVDILFNAAGFVAAAPCSNAPRATGTSRSISTSSRCTARSRRSCRRCWPRAAARSSTSRRPPARRAASSTAMSTAPPKPPSSG